MLKCSRVYQNNYRIVPEYLSLRVGAICPFLKVISARKLQWLFFYRGYAQGSYITVVEQDIAVISFEPSCNDRFSLLRQSYPDISFFVMIRNHHAPPWIFCARILAITTAYLQFDGYDWSAWFHRHQTALHPR